MYVVSATLMGMMLTFSAALAVLNLQSVPAALLPEAKPMGGVVELIGINNGAPQHLFDATPQRVYNCNLSMRRVVISARACPRRG